MPPIHPYHTLGTPSLPTVYTWRMSHTVHGPPEKPFVWASREAQ